MASKEIPADGGQRSKIGRPTKAEAGQRQRQLLDAAADLFLDMGYQNATLELIATAVGMTKRTIYSRHADKAALFLATVQHAIDRMTENQEQAIAAVEHAGLEEALLEILRFRLRQVMSPVGIKVQRMVFGESQKFPQIYQMTYGQVTKPVVDFVSDMLQRHAEAGEINLVDAKMTATALLSMATGGPARAIITGEALDEASIEQRAQFCVRLLLDGLGRKKI